MMKRFYSILEIIDPATKEYAVVVCETLNDEKDIRRQAYNQSKSVLPICSESKGIFLNEFEF